MKSLAIPSLELRKLGPAEKVIWMIDRVCRFNFLVHVELIGELPEQNLRLALDAVQDRHPLLRTRIEPRQAGVFFITGDAPRIPLRTVDSPEGAWEREAEAELREIMPWAQGPLCRATLVREPARRVLIIAFHHAVGDAMSGVYLLRDLMNSLSRISEGKGPSLAVLPLRESMERYFPKAYVGLKGAAGALGFTGRMLYQLARFGKSSLPTRVQKTSPARHRACLCSRELPPAVTESLQKKARSQGVTVHGALGAALIISIARELNAKEAKTFIIGHDVNLRQRLEPEIGEDVGFFISGVQTLHPTADGDDFWALATKVKKALDEGLSRGEQFLSFPRIIIATELAFRPLGADDFACRALAGSLDKAGSGMIPLSNIGKVELEPAAGLSLKSFGFASSFSATATFGVHAAALDSNLVLDFVGMEPDHERSTTQKVADLCREILIEKAAK